MRRKRVLIVDDSKVMHVELERFFDGSEFEVVSCCRSGEEAIEEYGRIRPDIVLMDIVMHGMDGIEASRIIRSQWPDAKILVVSSLVFDDVIASVKSVGGIGIIPKPLERDSLLAVMRKVFEVCVE